MNAPIQLWSVGQIAADVGVPVHRITYVIDRRGIRPAQRAANSRLFDAAAVARIRSELARIVADRTAPSLEAAR